MSPQDEEALAGLSGGAVPSLADQLAASAVADGVSAFADVLTPLGMTAGQPVARELSPAPAQRVPVTLPQRQYGDDKIKHLRPFSVEFNGKGSEVYQQPVIVVALDGSDAWSQVVAYYALDSGKLDCTKFHPIVKEVKPEQAAAG